MAKPVTITVAAQYDTSFTNLESNIISKLNDINGKIPKIKIQFDTKSIQSAVNELSSAMATITQASTKGISGQASSASIKQLTDATNDLARATERYKSVSKGSGGGSETSNIKTSATAYNQYTKALKDATSMLEKYSAAKNSSSPETKMAYGNIEAEISNLNRYYEELQNGTRSEEAFTNAVSQSQNVIAQAEAQIQHTADAYNQNATEAREAAEAQKEIASAAQEAQNGLQAYASAQQSSNDSVREAYSSYEEAANGMRQLSTAMSEESMSADEARDRLSQYQTQINSAKVELDGFIQEQEQVAQAQQEIASALQEAQGGLQAYATAQQSSNQAVSEAYSSYESAINGLNELNTALSNGSVSTDEARDKMSQYQTQIDSAKSVLDGYIQQQEQAAQAARELAQSQQDGEAAMRNSTAAIKNAQNMLTRYSSAANSSSQETRNAYKGIEEELERLNNLQKQYANNTISGTDFKTQVAQSQAQLRAYEQQIMSTGDATKSLGDRFSNLASKFTMWFSASQAIMLAIRSIREMISASIELDSAMAQLKIVTDETDDSYAQFADDIAQTAQNIGASITDLVDSTTTYARLGYNMEESSTLAEYTSMLKNVGDIEVDEAQEAITSIVKAFDVGVDDIEEVMDKLVAVGNNYPISVSEIAEGMTNASSTLSAAGNSLEESIALLTAANTTIQNVSRSSTGLRTIVARLRNTTTELDELGEDMTEAKYEELISTLTDANVALTDQNGEYRSTYDIMKDIAHEWNNLTSMEQAALAQTIAGTRQQAVFYSIIEQFQEAEGAMDTMADSAGTLTESYDIYMDTTQRHIDSFKAAFQELGSDLFQSGFLSGIVDIGTAIVNIIDKIVELINTIGGLPTVIGAVAGALVLLNFDSITTRITKMIESLKRLPNAISEVASRFTHLGKAASEAAEATTASTATIYAFPTGNKLTGGVDSASKAAATSGAAAAEGTSAAIAGISASAVAATAAVAGLAAAMIAYVAAYEYVEHAHTRAQEAAEKELAEYQEAESELESLNAQYEQNAARIAELNELKAAGTINLEQEAELQQLQAENEELKRQIEYREALAKLEAQEASAAATKSSQTGESYTEYLENSQGYGRFRTLIEEFAQGMGMSGSYWSGYESDLEKYNKGFMETGNSIDFTIQKLGEYKDALDSAQEELDKDPTNKVAERMRNEAQENFDNAISDLQRQEEEIEGWVEAWEAEGGNEDSIEYWTNQLRELQNAVMDFTMEPAKKQFQEIDNFFKEFDDDGSMRAAFMDAAESGRDFKEVLDELELEDLSIIGDDIGLKELEAYFREAGDYIAQNIDDIAKSLNIDLGSILTFPENSLEYTSLTIPEVNVPSSLSGTWQELQDTINNGIDFNGITVPDTVSGSWQELQQEISAFSDGQENLLSESAFSKSINSYITDVNKLTDAYKKLKDGSLDASEESELRNEFQELSQYSGDLDDQIIALIGDMQTDVISEFSDQINSVDSEEAREQLYQLMDAVLELGNLTDDFDFDIDVEIEGVDNLTSALNDSASAAGLTSEEITNLKSRYQDLDGYDPSKLFEETTNGIHLNAQALQDLEAEYQSKNFKDINGQLDGLMEQYRNLSQEIENCSDSSKRSELYAERDSIKNEIENVAQLAAQYDGLTSSYNQWINAQSTTDEDSMYNNISSSLEDIKQLYEDGRVGSDDFRTAVQMMTDVDLSTASVDELIAVYESGIGTMERFFTGNADGLQDFLDTALEVSDALGENWITLDDQGNYQFDFGVGGDEELAAAMSDLEGIQMSAEEVQIILRALSTYGFDINLDSPYTQFMNLKTAAEEYGEVLNEITGTDYTFNVNSDSIEDINDQIGELKEIISDNDFIVDGEFNMDVEGAEEAEGLMEALYEQKEALSAEVVMNIDTSGMEGDVYDTVRLLQDTLSAYSNYQMDVDLELDTAESESQLSELVSEIESLDAKTTADLGLNDSEFQAALSTIDANIEAGAELDPDALSVIESTIAGIEAEALVEFGVDSVLVDEYVASDHDSTGTVKWDNNTSLVDAYASTPKSASGVVKWTEDTSGVTTVFHATGTVKINQEVSSSSSSNSSSSSAKSSKSSSAVKANGTVNAYAAGTDVTVGEDGEAIVNELGEEGLIRNGILTRIRGGLQKIFLHAGDIILNHRQLEELDKNGMVTSNGGRGELVGNFLKGTMRAFSSGSGAFRGGASSSGSGSSTSSKTTTKTTTTTTTKSSGSSSSASSSSKSTSTSSSSRSSSSSTSSTKADDFEETFDWIEIKIDRLDRAIQRLDTRMSSTYKTWSQRNKALSEEIEDTAEAIELQRKAYERYKEQANSVNLSEYYKNLVRNGKIDISTITDEDLADRIKEYQEWYEKAIDCKLALDELQESEAELYRTSFDYVQKQYEELLDVIQFNMDMLDEAISQTEEHGYIVSTKYYEALISQENNNIKQMEEEQAALLDSLNAAISSGTIKVRSEEWYEMTSVIDAVTLAIEEANTALIEYNNSIRDIEWQVFDLILDRMDQIVTESDFLINLMSNYDLYDERGQFTELGRATTGLHAVNYDTYMQEADEYAKELENLSKEIASDPYNQDLIDRYNEIWECQQDMILAAEDEKQAIKDLVEEGIKLELDALKDLINEYEDALDAQKD